MLEAVDRRTPVGRRDYATLLLLVTYGLRAREIANLTLDDIDWKRERLHVRERKADHVAVYPLSPVVGEAILEYLRQGRPQTDDRHLFFRHLAPHRPFTCAGVSSEPATIFTRPVCRCAMPGRTRCAMRACSGSSMPASHSRRSATTSVTARRRRPRSMPRWRSSLFATSPSATGRRCHEARARRTRQPACRCDSPLAQLPPGGDVRRRHRCQARGQPATRTIAARRTSQFSAASTIANS
jgi:hypothetical protein